MATDPSSEPSAKRRKVNKAKPDLQTLPTKELLSNISLFDGDKVQIFCGGQEFNLPKALVCYHSGYFKGALNGPWIEATGLKISLDSEYSAETFELVVQWIYTSQINLPAAIEIDGPNLGTNENTANMSSAMEVEDTTVPTKETKRKRDAAARQLQTEQEAKTISQYIKFLALADYIELLGPFDTVITTVRDILARNSNALLSEHINSASKLPSGHPLRILVAQSCVGPYVAASLSTLRQGRLSTAKFRFKQELENNDIFALDLFKEYRKLLANREIVFHNKEWCCEVKDPVTKKDIRFLKR